MTKRTGALVVLGLLACGGPGDAPDDEVVDRVDLAAPLAFELAPGAQLVLADATVIGSGHGTVIIEALAVDATAGAMLELPLAERATALRLADAKGSRRHVVATGVPELASDAHTVDVQLVGLELGGFEAAWLVDAYGGRVALAEPLVVDASSLAWTAGELLVIDLAEDDDAARAGSGSAAMLAAARARSRTAGAVASGDADELAHARRTDGGIDPFHDELVGEADPIALEPGDSCSATSQCPIETRCVADPTMSDGQFRCLALCVEPELVNGAMPPVPSPSATCVDDGSCCDPDLACSNGECVVVAPDDGGGDDGSSTGDGCDRDKDGWVNGCDRKPDESCTHDEDDDGCNDSFDDNDDDPCECATPRIPKPKAPLSVSGARGRRSRSRRRSRHRSRRCAPSSRSGSATSRSSSRPVIPAAGARRSPHPDRRAP
jgi:hypothetical protein